MINSSLSLEIQSAGRIAFIFDRALLKSCIVGGFGALGELLDEEEIAEGEACIPMR